MKAKILIHGIIAAALFFTGASITIAGDPTRASSISGNLVKEAQANNVIIQMTYTNPFEPTAPQFSLTIDTSDNNNASSYNFAEILVLHSDSNINYDAEVVSITDITDNRREAIVTFPEADLSKAQQFQILVKGADGSTQMYFEFEPRCDDRKENC